MEEFDLFELVLRDALLSDCRNYSILSLHKVKGTEPWKHYSKEALEGLRVAKIFDHTSKKLIDTIIRKSEKGREFIEIEGNARLLEDFKHPSGKDLMTRIAQGIHETVCKSRGYRDMIEVVCSRDTYEYLRRELMCRSFQPPIERGGVIRFYGAKIRVADDLPHDFLVTEIWNHGSQTSDHCTDALKYSFGQSW